MKKARSFCQEIRAREASLDPLLNSQPWHKDAKVNIIGGRPGVSSRPNTQLLNNGIDQTNASKVINQILFQVECDAASTRAA